MPMFHRVSCVSFLGLFASLVAQQDPAAPAPAPAPTPTPTEVIVGAGAHRYRWVEGWGERGDGKELGSTHGCLVVDDKGQLLANTDTEAAVLVFSAEGKLQATWGKEWKGGLHGMCLRKEGDEQFLYLAHTGRHEVVKATLQGKVVWTLGWPQGAGIYESEEQYKPTAVAVAPDGSLFVADGYGKSWVHVYGPDRSYRKSIGGLGKEPGKFRTPHGLLLDTRGEEPLLLVADRENARLQWFTLAGEFVRKCDQGLKRPCNVWPLADGCLAVADLVGRVTILDREDKVVCHLGDNAEAKLQQTNAVDREHWRAGTFFAPHSVCADEGGNLYVMDWNRLGRITKLQKL